MRTKLISALIFRLRQYRSHLGNIELTTVRTDVGSTVRTDLGNIGLRAVYISREYKFVRMHPHNLCGRHFGNRQFISRAFDPQSACCQEYVFVCEQN